MASNVINYLDKHGLGTLISLVKKGQTGVYVVKGTAIYADADFLALTPAEKEAIDWFVAENCRCLRTGYFF